MLGKGVVLLSVFYTIVTSADVVLLLRIHVQRESRLPELTDCSFDRYRGCPLLYRHLSRCFVVGTESVRRGKLDLGSMQFAEIYG